MKIKAAILSAERYEELLREAEGSIVSELSIIMADNALVAVEYPNEMFKVIKYPRVASVTNEDVEDKLHVLVTKDELQQFIFLQGI